MQKSPIHCRFHRHVESTGRFFQSDGVTGSFSPKEQASTALQAGYIYHLVGGLEPWNFMTFHILGIS